MSKVLAFWKYAFELSAEEFVRLDAEGLAVMAAALSGADRRELRRWIAADQYWACKTTDGYTDTALGNHFHNPLPHARSDAEKHLILQRL